MAFDRVGVGEAACLNVFLRTMVDGAVTCEFVADRWINRRLVSHHVGLAACVLDDDRPQVLRGDVGNMEAPRLAAALYQGHDGLLTDWTATGMSAFGLVPIAFLAADVRLVDFN